MKVTIFATVEVATVYTVEATSNEEAEMKAKELIKASHIQGVITNIRVTYVLGY